MPDQTVELGHARSGIQNVADAVTSAGTNVSNGLSGWMKQVANLTAVGVIAVLVLLQSRDAAQQAHEDRRMFQDSIQELRRSQETRWQQTEQTHGRTMEALGTRIDRACTSLESATRAIEKKE